MSTEQALLQRSESKCELCSAAENLHVFEIPPSSDGSAEQSILICNTCNEQIDNLGKVDPDRIDPDKIDPDRIDPNKTNINHWRCLNDSMWSQVPAVQVMAWRILTRLSAEGWPQDLLDMLYLEDDILNWAKAADESQASESNVIHKDSNGAVLQAGDSITLIKDLNVKGANFTAKRGTAVRNISLVADNAEHIEGRVEGQRIVILTQFVKKSN